MLYQEKGSETQRWLECKEKMAAADRRLWKWRSGPSALHTAPGEESDAASEEGLAVVQKEEPDCLQALSCRDQRFV